MGIRSFLTRLFWCGVFLPMLPLGVSIAQAADVKKGSRAISDAALKAEFNEVGPKMSEVGVEATRIAGGKSDGLFLYIEMDRDVPMIIVMRDRGKTVKWFMASEHLRDLVAQLWAIPNPNRRWATMAYEVTGEKFDTHMRYPEEVDFKTPFEERLFAAVPKRFGGKKVVMDPLLKAELAEK